MSDLARFVEHSERLTDVFGAWPSFHDAEVVAIDLWRGDVRPERDSWIGAVLTTKIQILEATQPGATHSGNDTLATLRFHEADRVHLHGFNHQNAILGLVFQHEPRGEGLAPYIRVHFQAAFGVDATFVCMRIEVVSAEPYTDATRNI